jgi:hypothetical protein
MMPRIILVVAALIVVVILVRSRNNHPAVKTAPLAGPIGSLEGDRQVLEQLRRAGANLSKPTEVNYYLYFKDREAADSAAAEAGNVELKATVQRAADNSAWLVLVSGNMIPTEAAIHANTTRLLALAHAHGGEYDGWEAALEK